MREQYQHVGVVSGHFKSVMFLLAAGDHDPVTESCSVYTILSGQADWAASTRTIKHARAIAGIIRTEGGTCEVVYSFGEAANDND